MMINKFKKHGVYSQYFIKEKRNYKSFVLEHREDAQGSYILFETSSEQNSCLFQVLFIEQSFNF